MLCRPRDRSGRSAWLKVVPGLTPELDTAKIGSEGRVEAQRARLRGRCWETKNVSTRPGPRADLGLARTTGGFAQPSLRVFVCLLQRVGIKDPRNRPRDKKRKHD